MGLQKSIEKLSFLKSDHLDKKAAGRLGENAAANFLRKKGYKILERNYTAKVGEIDLVVSFQGIIIFVEVKTRGNTEFGLPCEAVTFSKQRKILKTATYYMMEHKMESDIRFDVVEVYTIPKGKRIHIRSVNHIENAFSRPDI